MKSRRVDTEDLRSMLSLTFSLRHGGPERFEMQIDTIIRRFCRLLPADSAQVILVRSTGESSRGITEISADSDSLQSSARQGIRRTRQFMMEAGTASAGHVFTGLGEPAWLTLRQPSASSRNVLHSLQVVPRSGSALGLIFRRDGKRSFGDREWIILDTFWRSQRIQSHRKTQLAV